MEKLRLLLLSNSRSPRQGYLEHALPLIRCLLGPQIDRVLFVPYAAVVWSFDEYEAAVRDRFSEIGYPLTSIHHEADVKQAVRGAQAIVIGGGNTFHLLQHLYEADLIEAIRERATGGMPYIGWSAGSNVACPTIKTTNDMPIVESPTLKSLNLVPFQINPHYLDVHPEGHQGETREERILEFIEVNGGVPVVGLREGSILRVESNNIQLLGQKSARIFIKGQQPREYSPEESLQFLLTKSS